MHLQLAYLDKSMLGFVPYKLVRIQLPVCIGVWQILHVVQIIDT